MTNIQISNAVCNLYYIRYASKSSLSDIPSLIISKLLDSLQKPTLSKLFSIVDNGHDKPESLSKIIKSEWNNNIYEYRKINELIRLSYMSNNSQNNVKPYKSFTMK